MPQGFLAAGNAYTPRYGEVINDIPRKVKCVDDTLFNDSSVEESFYHTWDFLTLCAEKGIVINVDKFQLGETLYICRINNNTNRYRPIKQPSLCH